jgi:hypothetical protein
MSTSPNDTLCSSGSSRERFATSRIPTPLSDSKEGWRFQKKMNLLQHY